MSEQINLLNREIERRFFIDPTKRLLNLCNPESMGLMHVVYLYVDTKINIRVRNDVSKNTYQLTIKIGHGLDRLEYNFELSEDTYNELISGKKVLTYKMRKVLVNGVSFVLKVIENTGDALGTYYILEREFNTIKDAKEFRFPELSNLFCYSIEITDNQRYEMSRIYKRLTSTTAAPKNGFKRKLLGFLKKLVDKLQC